MHPTKGIIMKHARRESTKDLQKTEGRGEDTTHLKLRVLQIQTRNLQKLIVILTQTCLHHLI
jgi:hypothetical protein